MSLSLVTFTGADNSIPAAQLVGMWKAFPFIEWGILIGTQAGTARFPDAEWITELIRFRKSVGAEDMPLSLHLCGAHLRGLCSLQRGRSIAEFMGDSLQAFHRVQLNWHGYVQSPEVLQYATEAITELFPDHKPAMILQLDNVNNTLLQSARMNGIELQGLFDASGGAGELPVMWPDALPDIVCGWSGGLGPHNIAEELPKIDARARRSTDYWIDMETHVRSNHDQLFDIDKVGRVSAACQQFMQQQLRKDQG